MALTQPYENFEKPGIVVGYKLSNVKVYKGALLAVNSSGYAIPLTHATASLKFIGIANETIDNSAGNAGDKSINVTKSGSFVFKAAAGFAPAQADIGKELYALSDWEVQIATAGLTNQYKVGRILGLESTSTGVTGVRLRVEDYVQ
ncbi:MAG: hypothetical protein ABL949_11685 [Fimbriimonadaceae bacterium]